MKIVLITHTAYPEYIGGREQHVHNIANALSRYAQVSVISTGLKKEITRQKIRDYTLISVPAVRMVLSANPLQIYRISPKMYGVLKAESPDIVHAFEYGSFSTDIAWIYSLRNNIPFFLTIYGYQLGNVMLRAAKKLYDLLIGRRILGSAKNIFCPSTIQTEEAKKILADENDSDKIILQPNCIPVSDYSAVPADEDFKNSLGIEKEQVVISCVARMLPRKGIKTLIKAADRLFFNDGIRNFKVLIVGPDRGQMKNLKQTIKDNGLDECVNMVGPQPHEKTKQIISLSDIFVLCSLYEGLPLSLLEAMAMSKAVVFSRLPCAGQIIRHRHNGILFDPGDSKMLADILKELIQDKELRDLLSGNAAEAVSAFDSGKEAEVTLGCYQKGIYKENRTGNRKISVVKEGYAD